MTEPSDFVKARLGKLPPVPAFTEDPIQDDTTDTSTETDSSTASIQTIIPSHTDTRPTDPIPWTHYFSENITIPSSRNPEQTFNVYYTPPTTETAPVYIFHHGAGSSALSFALVAKYLTTSINCGVIAFDVRYHGKTTFQDEPWDLLLSTLATDQIDIINGISSHSKWSSRDQGWPDLILVGHRYSLCNRGLIVVLEELFVHILLLRI
jgi:protein phosphatase methylesterase 1